MSNSSWPHALQHTRPLCRSSSPRVCPSPCPLNQWCHPTISSSVTFFFFCLQSFPASGPFQMSPALCKRWPKCWSLSFSTSPSDEYSGLTSFRIDWFDLLAVQGTLKSLLQHHSSKASFSGTLPSLWCNSHICTWLLERQYTDLCQQSDVFAF